MQMPIPANYGGDMEYLAALRVGQNDIKALLNLETPRRERVAPLLMMRGNDTKYIDNFLKSWGETDFYLDVSRYETDENDVFITSTQINNPNNSFTNKYNFFHQCKHANNSLIPTVGWKTSDTTRDVVQLALNLERSNEIIALRLDQSTDREINLNTLRNILNSVNNPGKFDVIIDYGFLPNQVTPPNETSKIVKELTDQYGIRKIILLSTAYPDDKPTSGSNRKKTCNDLVWQIPFIKSTKNEKLIYGDYAATNPISAIEYIQGMPTIPFANYLEGTEWWQGRKGKDKQYIKYIDLANEIIQLNGFHQSNFCWATEEIARIAGLPAVQGQKYGSNGSWNGYKVNQHICAILHNFDSMKGTAAANDEDEDEEELI